MNARLPRSRQNFIDLFYGHSGTVSYIHRLGVIDLENDVTRMRDVLPVDVETTIDLLASAEAAYATMRGIHVHLDNARCHHSRTFQESMK